MKSRSRVTIATPFANSAEPASSNQFCGASMADIATVRAPLSMGTMAFLDPVQLRLPLESTSQDPPVALLNTSNGTLVAELSASIHTVCHPLEELFRKYPASPSSAEPTTPISGEVVPPSPQTPTPRPRPETVEPSPLSLPCWPKTPMPTVLFGALP